MMNISIIYLTNFIYDPKCNIGKEDTQPLICKELWYSGLHFHLIWTVPQFK